MVLSIVIPAYNEEDTIAGCLEAIAGQRTREEFEVIVVDNGSQDRTAAIAGAFKTKMKLRVLEERTKGRGAARARGFGAAHGTIILSSDADARVPPDWIDVMVGALKRSGCVAVTGPCHIDDCSSLSNRLFNAFQPVSMRIYRSVTGHYWLTGSNFAITRDAYAASGGFNPEINAQEDIDLSFRVRRVGEIRFVPGASVWVSGRRFKRGLFRGLFPYASTFTQTFVFKRHVDLSDDR